jgi:hypothetical protein
LKEIRCASRLCLSVADFSQVAPGPGRYATPDASTDKRKILAEHAQKAQVSTGIFVAEGSAVRVIFAAWLVLALLLLGLGQLTTARDRDAAPRRASVVR